MKRRPARKQGMSIATNTPHMIAMDRLALSIQSGLYCLPQCGQRGASGEIATPQSEQATVLGISTPFGA